MGGYRLMKPISNSEIKRMIKQGGTSVNGVVITDPYKVIEYKEGDIIKYGKRTFFKIVEKKKGTKKKK